jgi:hypothetical protein
MNVKTKILNYLSKADGYNTLTTAQARARSVSATCPHVSRNFVKKVTASTPTPSTWKMVVKSVSTVWVNQPNLWLRLL